jgi:hypothetical protein
MRFKRGSSKYDGTQVGLHIERFPTGGLRRGFRSMGLNEWPRKSLGPHSLVPTNLVGAGPWAMGDFNRPSPGPGRGTSFPLIIEPSN